MAIMTGAIIARLMTFRKEVVTLFRAFMNPATPNYLKVATILVALYVVSPFDIVPDFIPVLGWIDDLVLIPLAVSWIVGRLPPDIRNPDPARNAKTIDGTARRR